MIDVRAVGGGFRGRPELGRWRLQCGEEGLQLDIEGAVIEPKEWVRKESGLVR